MPSPSGAGPAPSPGCAPPARWRRAWASAPACALLPVDTLHAVAEEARHRFGATQVVAVLDARMDQVYAARYDFGAAQPAAAEPQLLAPEEVVVPPGWALAGNAFAAYGERLPAAAARHEALPTAAAMLRLAPALLAAGAQRSRQPRPGRSMFAIKWRRPPAERAPSRRQVPSSST